MFGEDFLKFRREEQMMTVKCVQFILLFFVGGGGVTKFRGEGKQRPPGNPESGPAVNPLSLHDAFKHP